MQMFAERYGFKIQMDSTRCRFIPTDKDECPGDVTACGHLHSPEECRETGGTVVTVRFRPEAAMAKTEH
ncbi:MAG: hypothetical protein ACM3KE_01330, partial [Hyphomicrobiales bacterium]